MSNIGKLNKILNIREDEKNKALIDQQKAIDIFENVGMKLYEALKKKEIAEDHLYEQMQAQEIQRIREQTAYIDGLNRAIESLQKEVQIARQHMEKKKKIVTEKYIEYKKIEKLIANRLKVKEEQNARFETQEMDEISITQFIRAK